MIEKKRKIANMIADIYHNKLYIIYLNSKEDEQMITNVFTYLENRLNKNHNKDKIEKYSNNCLMKYKEFSKIDEKNNAYISNVISIRNIKEITRLAKISIVISIVSVLLALVSILFDLYKTRNYNQNNIEKEFPVTITHME